MEKKKLKDCAIGEKVRFKPNSAVCEVQQHFRGLTRVTIGADGFWRDQNEVVYIQNPTTSL